MKVLVCALVVLAGPATAQAQQQPYPFAKPPLADDRKTESNAPRWEGPAIRLTPQQLGELLQKRSAHPAPKAGPKMAPPGKLCLLQSLGRCAQEAEIIAKPYEPGEAELYFLKPETPTPPAPPAGEGTPRN
jgi:hypothetical protein